VSDSRRYNKCKCGSFLKADAVKLEMKTGKMTVKIKTLLKLIFCKYRTCIFEAVDLMEKMTV